jgi:mannosyltransferase OCH1-like enzyme
VENNLMIPKIIHHIWVGGNPLPTKFQILIDEARALHPDFEFKFWNDANVSITSPFIKRCYEKRKWAFASDYLRFELLFNHGGIYLDTDMQVLKPLNVFLNCGGFSGLNRNKDSIYCGIIGSVPKHPLIGEIVAAYNNIEDGAEPTSPQIFTNIYKLSKYANFKIYPHTLFYPIDEGQSAVSTDLVNAYTNHLWEESWRRYVIFRRLLRRLGIMNIYHKAFKKSDQLKFPTLSDDEVN